MEGFRGDLPLRVHGKKLRKKKFAEGLQIQILKLGSCELDTVNHGL